MLDSARTALTSAEEMAATHYNRLTHRRELNDSFEQELEIEMVMVPNTVSDPFMARYRAILKKYREVNTAYRTFVDAIPSKDNASMTEAELRVRTTAYSSLTNRLKEIDTSLTKLMQDINELDDKISDDSLANRRKSILNQLLTDRSILEKVTVFNTDNYENAVNALIEQLNAIPHPSTGNNWDIYEALTTLRTEQVTLSRQIGTFLDTQQEIQDAIKHHLPQRLASARNLVSNTNVSESEKVIFDKWLNDIEGDVTRLKTNVTLDAESLLRLKDNIIQSLDDITRDCRAQRASTNPRRPRR